jgi:putative membrane protein
MAGYEAFWGGSEWWWVFPLVMIVLCFLMMRRRGGSMMCGFGSRSASDTLPIDSSDSAMEILDKRYALGEIGKEEYEEKKIVIGQIKTKKAEEGGKTE